MLAEKENFLYGNAELGIPGCKGNSIDLEVAEEIWNRMKKFAEYAFNKSHAACYAAIAMQTAYLKAHYPAEFEAGLLTAYTGTLDKFIPYINECRQKKIIIRNPDINKSEKVFVANSDGSVTYGLLSVKGIGSAVLDDILSERQNGEYRSLDDLIKRTGANKKAIESLIKAGALDSFGHTRRSMIESVSGIISAEKKNLRNNIDGQLNLFEMLGLDSGDGVTELPEYDKKTLLTYEKESLGFYLSGHPVETYLEKTSEPVQMIACCKNPEAEEDAEQGETLSIGSKVTLLAQITAVKKITTKKGDPMAIITVEDMTGEIRAVCFPRTYYECRDVIKEDAIILISGVLEYELDGVTVQVIVNEINDVSPISGLFPELPQ